MRTGVVTADLGTVRRLAAVLHDPGDAPVPAYRRGRGPVFIDWRRRPVLHAALSGVEAVFNCGRRLRGRSQALRQPRRERFILVSRGPSRPLHD